MVAEESEFALFGVSEEELGPRLCLQSHTSRDQLDIRIQVHSYTYNVATTAAVNEITPRMVSPARRICSK